MNKRIISFAVFFAALVVVVGFSVWGYRAYQTRSREASIRKATTFIQMTTEPQFLKAGETSKLQFVVKDATGTPVNDAIITHDREAHVIIVGQNLATFAHLHPEDFKESVRHEKGEYDVEYRFPLAGHYIVSFEITRPSGTTSKVFPIDIGGPQFMSELKYDNRSQKCFKAFNTDGHDRFVESILFASTEVRCPEGYKVTFSKPEGTVHASVPTTLRYRIEKGGSPVKDIEPYLNAAMHIIAVPENLSIIIHSHGMVASAADGAVLGDIASEPIIFPAPGRYQIISQFKHEGGIIATAFMLTVEE